MAPSSASWLADHISQLQIKRDELARQLENELRMVNHLTNVASHINLERGVLADHAASEDDERDATMAELCGAEEALKHAQSETTALLLERKNLLGMISDANALLATCVGQARDTANAAALCQAMHRNQERRARSLSSSLRGWGDSQVNLTASKENEKLSRRRCRESMRAWLDRKTMQRSVLEARLAGQESQVAYWSEKLSESELAEEQAQMETQAFRVLTAERSGIQVPGQLADHEELQRRLSEIAVADEELRSRLDEATRRMHQKDLRLRQSSAAPWEDQAAEAA